MSHLTYDGCICKIVQVCSKATCNFLKESTSLNVWKRLSFPESDENFGGTCNVMNAGNGNL